MVQQAQRVAPYCHVSTISDRQVRDLTALAGRAGHLVASFLEKASGADSGRPERRKVLELATRREIADPVGPIPF